MGEQELKIGIIGAGAIVRDRHMPGLAEIDGVRVVAVCNRRRERAKTFARDYDVPTVCDDWRDVVAMDELDIIWIGATPYLHCPISTAALEAGKHVFCQARMCMDLDEARQMVAAARAHPDRVVMICPPPTGMTNDRAVRRLLGQDGYVGKIRHVELRDFSDFCADPSKPLHWRMDERISGLNTLSVGICVEVLSRWVGPARRLKAHAKIYTPHRRDPESGQMHTIRIPEEVVVVGDLEGGGTFDYHWSGVAVGPGRNVVEVFGSEGQLVYDLADEAGGLRGAKKGQAELKAMAVPAGERRRWTVEADFIRAVRTGDRSHVEPDFDEGLGYMAFLQAMWDSAGAEGYVDVPEC